MRANVIKMSAIQLPFIILALVCAALAALLMTVSSMMAAQYDEVLTELNAKESLVSETPYIFKGGIVITEAEQI